MNNSRIKREMEFETPKVKKEVVTIKQFFCKIKINRESYGERALREREI